MCFGETGWLDDNMGAGLILVDAVQKSNSTSIAVCAIPHAEAVSIPCSFAVIHESKPTLPGIPVSPVQSSILIKMLPTSLFLLLSTTSTITRASSMGSIAPLFVAASVFPLKFVASYLELIAQTLMPFFLSNLLRCTITIFIAA